MTVIKVIFDGRNFVPQEPVSLPPQSSALVVLQEDHLSAQAQVDSEIRAYYEAGSDAEDEAWGNATAPDSYRAWDED